MVGQGDVQFGQDSVRHTMLPDTDNRFEGMRFGLQGSNLLIAQPRICHSWRLHLTIRAGKYTGTFWKHGRQSQ